MSFDPAAFESLEALGARNDREADRDEIDAKLATNGVDYKGVRDLMYGDLQPRTTGEIEAAKVAEANEPNPDDILMSELEGAENGEIIGGGDSEILSGSQGGDNLGELEGNFEQQREITEGVFSPRIDSYALQGKIIGDEAKVLKTTLLSKNISDIDTIPDSELSSEKKTLVIDLLTESEKPENQIKYSENFTKDFGSELSEFQNSKGEFTSETDQTAFDMISARYITSNEIDVSSEDRKKDLDSAFITALNTEIDGKQFKRNETFKQITIDIKNNSLPVSNRFAAYKDLLSFTSLEQGKGGKQQEMRYRKRAAEQLLVVSGRQERFNQLLDFFKAQKENSIQAIDAAVKLEAIRVEVGLSQGDANLLTGGDIDVMNNNIPETPGESA